MTVVVARNFWHLPKVSIKNTTSVSPRARNVYIPAGWFLTRGQHGHAFSLLYLSFLNDTLSFPKRKGVTGREKEKEDRREARLRRHGALSVTKQESRRGITDATIITYEQHIAWQEEPREHRGPRYWPLWPPLFLCAGLSVRESGLWGPSGPELRNMPTRICAMDIPARRASCHRNSPTSYPRISDTRNAILVPGERGNRFSTPVSLVEMSKDTRRGTRETWLSATSY